MPQTIPETAPATVSTPSLLRRLMAVLYDTMLVIPLALAVTALSIALKAQLVGGVVPGQPALTGLAYVLNLVLVLAAIAAFFIGFWTRAERTLGMQAWRLRIRQPDGRPITPRQASIRLGMALVSAACGGLGYWSILWDREKRSWHDRVSGTRVVLLPKPPKD